MAKQQIFWMSVLYQNNQNAGLWMFPNFIASAGIHGWIDAKVLPVILPVLVLTSSLARAMARYTPELIGQYASSGPRGRGLRHQFKDRPGQTNTARGRPKQELSEKESQPRSPPGLGLLDSGRYLMPASQSLSGTGIPSQIF